MTKKVVFLGDSLTGFYDWQKRFPEYQVVNLGTPGDTVEGLLARLQVVRDRVQNADYIFLMIGVNDISMRQYDIEDTYRRIVSTLRVLNAKARIVIESILPVGLGPETNTAIRDANRRLREMAREYGAEYLDLYDHFLDRQGAANAYLQSDGIHLRGAGYEVWTKQVEHVLQHVK